MTTNCEAPGRGGCKDWRLGDGDYAGVREGGASEVVPSSCVMYYCCIHMGLDAAGRGLGIARRVDDGDEEAGMM